jgi:ABC-type multidrug transport system fused ATPase/permease subunit
VLTCGLQVVFDHVEMRYRPGLPLVLKGLSVRIPAGSKCGVVGRTGQCGFSTTYQHLLLPPSACLPGAPVYPLDAQGGAQ